MRCGRDDCYWPRCVGPAGCQATPVSVEPRKVWKDPPPPPPKKQPSKKRPDRFSVSISGESYRRFKAATLGQGRGLATTLEQEITRFLGSVEKP